MLFKGHRTAGHTPAANASYFGSIFPLRSFQISFPKIRNSHLSPPIIYLLEEVQEAMKVAKALAKYGKGK